MLQTRERATLWGLRGLLGLAVGGACVWLSLRGLDGAQLRASLSQVHWLWLGAAFLSVVMVSLLKSVRWWLLYPAALRPVSWLHTFSALLTAQMVNVLIPIRLGEVLRLGLMFQEGCSPATTLGSIVVEKSLDLLAVGGLLMLALPLVALPTWFPVSGGMEVGATGLALLSGLLLVWALRQPLQTLAAQALAWCAWLPDKWRARLLRLFSETLAGLGALSDYRAAGQVLGVTALIWSFSALTMQLMLQAFDLPLAWMVGVTLMLALTLSNLIPQAPALLGMVGYVTRITLESFGVASAQAAALGLLLNVVMVSPLVLLGGWATWMRFAGLGHLPWRERWASSLGFKRVPPDENSLQGR